LPKPTGELVRSNPDMTAYAIAKAAGCDVKTAAKYRAP
jgi:hypothetical protein